MWIAVLLFGLGLVLVVKGGDAFVDAATWMAEVSGIPTFIVGATIVSLATTLPEMLVSVMAAAQGSVEMACGNAIGSVVANTGLILAIAMIAIPTAVKCRDYLFKSVALIGTVVILLVFGRGGALRWTGSVVLVLIFLAFMVENVLTAKKAMENVIQDKPDLRGKTIAKNAALFALGAAGIVLGAHLMVDNATLIAQGLGVPESVIAVTIVAVGTSLPELVTTITAIVKKQASLSAGNILGANIIDNALILPVCSLVSGQELPLGAQTLRLDLPASLAITLLALLPMLFKEKFMRWQGVGCLALYAVYLVLVIL